MKILAQDYGRFDLSSRVLLFTFEQTELPNYQHMKLELRVGGDPYPMAGGGVYAVEVTLEDTEEDVFQVFDSDVLVKAGVTVKAFDAEFLAQKNDTVRVYLTGLAADVDVRVSWALCEGVNVTELEGAVAGFAFIDKAEAGAGGALTTYDSPTKAEMDAAHALLATAAVCTEARLAELDAANLPADVDALILDQLPYAPDACITVEAGATDLERGTNLATAYAAACALTPGGAALSHTNRACVLLPPGGSDVAAVTLVLDTEYVDVIATDPQRGGLPQAMDVDEFNGATSLAQFRPPPTVVYSETDDTTVVEQAVQDVRLTGFAIAQLSGDGSGTYHAFRCSVDDNAGSRYDMMYFWHKAPYITRHPVSFVKHVKGDWQDCIANSDAWRAGTDGEFSPVMRDCYAGSFSFIGDADGTSVVGCMLTRCKTLSMYGSKTSGYGSFAGCTWYSVPIDSDSVFTDCEAGERSFGLGMKNEGTFIRCRGGDYCFGSTTHDLDNGEFAGYAEDCVGGRGSFGGRLAGITWGMCTGTLIRCVSRGSELPLRLEGATVEGCLLTTGVADQDGVTLLDGGSRIHDSTILVVEGGTGIPINAGSAQTVSAAGNRYNNRSASVTGLGPNVTNTGAGEPAAILADTGEIQTDWHDGGRLDEILDGRATPADVHTTVTPAYGRGSSRRVGGIIHLPEDSDETLAWHLADSDGEDVDLTGYTGLALEVYAASGDLLFERTLANGGLVIDNLEHGRVTITFTPDNLATAGTCKYEFWGTQEGGLPTCLARGSLIIEPTFGPTS